jgi:hypothetical protein
MARRQVDDQPPDLALTQRSQLGGDDLNPCPFFPDDK